MSLRAVVIADTGPINYLVLTGDIALLPKLFGKVLVPRTVCAELAKPRAPEPVRAWIAQPPSWLEIHADPVSDLAGSLKALDDGERAAIALAVTIHADLVLMDDQDGVAVARRSGLAVTGTLGVLDLAARRGLIDLAEAFKRLKTTGFYYRQGLLDSILAQHERKT